MRLFRSSYMHAMTTDTVSNCGPGTANVHLLRSIWNLDSAAPSREKAPDFVETDIYRTGCGGGTPRRRRRRSHRS